MSAARVFELHHGKASAYLIQGTNVNVGRALERSGLGQVVTVPDRAKERRGFVLSEEGRRVMVAMGHVVEQASEPPTDVKFEAVRRAGDQLAKVAAVLAGNEPTAQHAIAVWNRAAVLAK